MPKRDPSVEAHLEWLGFVRPTGLVVSAPALVRADAILPRDPEGHRLLQDCAVERPLRPGGEPEWCLPDFRAFASSVLGWTFSPRGYAGTDACPIPPELKTPLQEGGEILSPDFAVRERDPQGDAPPWQLLVQVIEAGEDFDRVTGGAGQLEVSAHGRMERLLRQTGVPAGLLCNARSLRLVSAPRGESSGWFDLHVADMVTTAGRPIVAALRLLLRQTRLLSLPREKRFAALLADSRRFQNEVSERLAEQVLHALYELLRGVQAADDAARGALLRETLDERPDDVYHALLTVILRLVFLLYAEERDLLPQGETFARHYSLAGLYERLREDAALHPDTMNQRYGAWAQLLVLFRLFHDGAEADDLHLPPRPGDLFAPDRFPFLEGRRAGGARQVHERIEPPLAPDGAVHRALDKLLVLDGERISYRALDVEQIGSVYETMMGFRLETARGRSVAIKPAKKLGAPSTVDLDALLAQPPGKRAKWLQARADRNLTDTIAKALRAAGTVDDLHAALDRVLDKDATPDLVPPGALVLQPGEERRRSGSHYTPRELTEPIVRHTLAPLLARLRGKAGGAPTAAQILDLKVCDPAMGSGAFLVETCRQLADALIEAWGAHGDRPAIPPAEDEVIHARRLVARRCLYGIDRNPMAVDLARVSLWLSTLARDHPLTFVDHAMRHGDSLVGLSRRQIEAFHWLPDTQPLQTGFEVMRVREHVEKVEELRRRIREVGAEVSDRERRDLWRDARDEIDAVRLFGDLALAAFFAEARPKQREAKRLEFAGAVVNGETIRYLSWLEEQRHSDPPLAPFHWEIEFPEVFERENPGFDAFVGNPPFLGGKRISTTLGTAYRDWLSALHAESSSNTDLVAHFFRRAFNLLRGEGTFGLIATNTIAQGDTRSGGLRWICEHSGEIYRATRRVQWPGDAAVVVSVLHIAKGQWDRDETAGNERHQEESPGERDTKRAPAGSRLAGDGKPGGLATGRFAGNKVLDGANVDTITAFLFHRGGHADPVRLEANADKSFIGSFVLGMGFTFDDTDKKGITTPLAEMRRLVETNPRNQEAIFPYIGGAEVNASPTHAHYRYVIDFRDYPLRREDLGETWRDADAEQRRKWLRSGVVPPDFQEPVAADWADLLAIVEEKVKPERDVQNRKALRDRWWHYADKRPGLNAAITGLDRVLTNPQVSANVQFAFLPSDVVFAHTLNIFPFDTHAAFCTIQSRSHEIWARFFSSTFGDGLRYTPSDCFETFPFPDCTARGDIRSASGLPHGVEGAPGDDPGRGDNCDAWTSHPNLEAAGRAYYEHRAALMIRNDEGMTKTYNRFHDPYENDPEIGKLRELHAAMDRAVLDAYGWTDIPTDCQFLLDYEIDEATWGRRKKPYRYRWPDPVRDEVLARLLALNAERAAGEARAGGSASKASPPARPASRRSGGARASEPRPLWRTPDA